MTARRSSSEVFGARGRIGAQGERCFTVGLRNAGLDRYVMRVSLDIPTGTRQRPLRGDVDCVVANGNSVVLIDVKRWDRAVYWTVPGTRIGMKDLLPLPGHGIDGLSANMSAALDRYQAALPTANVSALVAFVPTKVREIESVPISVRFLVWPGGIRSYLAGAAFGELYRRLGDHPEEVPQATLRLLDGLVRR